MSHNVAQHHILMGEENRILRQKMEPDIIIIIVFWFLAAIFLKRFIFDVWQDKINKNREGGGLTEIHRVSIGRKLKNY